MKRYTHPQISEFIPPGSYSPVELLCHWTDQINRRLELWRCMDVVNDYLGMKPEPDRRPELAYEIAVQADMDFERIYEEIDSYTHADQMLAYLAAAEAMEAYARKRHEAKG